MHLIGCDFELIRVAYDSIALNLGNINDLGDECPD